LVDVKFLLAAVGTEERSHSRGSSTMNEDNRFSSSQAPALKEVVVNLRLFRKSLFLLMLSCWEARGPLTQATRVL